MAAESQMLPLGTEAPDFALPDVVTGETASPPDLSEAAALLVMFICNHCPFVKHVRRGLAALGRDHTATRRSRSSRSTRTTVAYPDDGPAKMAEEAREAGAMCSPTSSTRRRRWRAHTAPRARPTSSCSTAAKLVYRGQFDDSRPERQIAGHRRGPARRIDARARRRAGPRTATEHGLQHQVEARERARVGLADAPTRDGGTWSRPHRIRRRRSSRWCT